MLFLFIMRKTSQYAMLGFLFGFIATFVGCNSWLGKTSHGEGAMFGTISGLVIGGLFGIIGGVIGTSVDRGNFKNSESSSADILNALEKLNKLKQDGAISEEEFNAQKSKILNK